MKKTIAILLCLVMAISLMTACSGNAGKKEEPAPAAENLSAPAAIDETVTLKIVTTIFPVFDWVRAILGDRASDAELTMLLDSGVDLHSYQPTAQDILTIATCDLFIYVGGESDGWVEDALAHAENPDMQVINLLEVLGDQVKAEEIVEGMEHDHEHEDGEDEDHDHDHEEGEEHEHDHEEEEVEYDEHVWLSLRNAQALCRVIAETLSLIDPENADAYAANLAAYDAQLSDLDARYAEAVADAPVRTVLFGDRFPFRYLVDDYDLDYYAAFVGCSAESEASFETIMFLAGKVDELGLHAILQIESADGSIARTIRDTTETKDQEILTMDSLQATTAKGVAEGVTYLGVMESNLEVLSAALNA